MMKMQKKILIPILVLAMIFLSSFVFANMVTTTMTWVVASAKSHSIAYGGSCSATAFFFVETNAVQDNDADGNAAKILPYNLRSGGSACQAAGTASMVISNTGTIATNIDANFAAALDANIWLKVWMGNGDAATDCGTDGLGGWAKICSLPGAADVTTPVTYTTCRDFNSSNSTTGARLVTGLTITDTNHLCFSGELVGPVIDLPSKVSGNIDHNGTFQTSTDVS